MPDLLSPGSAGFGQFRVDPATGEVRFDPGSNASWPAGATTQTRLYALWRDAAGREVVSLATVDVTREAAASGAQIISLVHAYANSNVPSFSAQFGAAEPGDLRIAVLSTTYTTQTPSGAAGFSPVGGDTTEGTFKVEVQEVTEANVGPVTVTWSTGYKTAASLAITLRGASPSIGNSARSSNGYGSVQSTPAIGVATGSRALLIGGVNGRDYSGVTGLTPPSLTPPSDGGLWIVNQTQRLIVLFEDGVAPTHPAREFWGDGVANGYKAIAIEVASA